MRSGADPVQKINVRALTRVCVCVCSYSYECDGEIVKEPVYKT